MYRKEYKLVIWSDDEEDFRLAHGDVLNSIHNAEDDYSEVDILLREIDV